MDQRENKINQLLLDNRFVDWVVDPDSPYGEYWREWTAASEEKASLAAEARRFLLELKRSQREAEGGKAVAGLKAEMWDSIAAGVREYGNESSIEEPPLSRRVPILRYWLGAAAVAGLVLVAGVGLLHKHPSRLVPEAPPKEQLASTEIIRYNGSERNELFYLPDGSHITLGKGARISYSRLLSGAKREVSLVGEAYFDIAPHPAKPFCIYTPHMEVKILGTSLRISTDSLKESVAVRSGKVAVSMKTQGQGVAGERILYPQQACTFNVRKKQLSMAAPLKASSIEIRPFNTDKYDFEDAPLSDVFAALEKMYSIPVRYDSMALKSCYITISLGDESLEDKLKVITKTIGASFSISDYGIDVEGGSCK
ncbi:MAG: FecR domain-containing protein [Bacteroidetes bacterium]|nr:FecR domain-containing protein [Bacteroidota bacterium]